MRKKLKIVPKYDRLDGLANR